MMQAEDAALLAKIRARGLVQPDLRAVASQLYESQARADHLWRLVDQDWVIAEPMLRATRCPACQSHEMLAHERCPNCRCANLLTQPLYHHIPCAGIFEFQGQIEDLAQCPKCKSALNQEQDRIELAGQIYHCLDCAQRFPEPVIEFWCLPCNQSHRLEAVSFHRLYAFRLSEAGELALRSHLSE